MISGKVYSQIKEGVAWITFSHPQSNSMPGLLLRQLANEISEAGKNPEAKVIIVQSEGEKVFCAGASFDEMAALKNQDEANHFFEGFSLVINAMRRSPKFIIARIQGKAAGGGVGIACAADYTLALQSASVKLSELAIGIGPFAVGPAVARKIGPAAFTELAINATEWRDAAWAKQKGMYAEVFPTTEELDKAVFALASRLAQSNPDAMRELKKVIWEGTEHWDKLLIERSAISARLALGEFTKKAIAKFKAGN